MAKDDLSARRYALIEDIQKLGRSYEAVAESSALSWARRPGDKSCESLAREAVIKHDERKYVADEVIKLVWKHWPGTIPCSIQPSTSPGG